jgi:hypothetical protein
MLQALLIPEFSSIPYTCYSQQQPLCELKERIEFLTGIRKGCHLTSERLECGSNFFYLVVIVGLSKCSFDQKINQALTFRFEFFCKPEFLCSLGLMLCVPLTPNILHDLLEQRHKALFGSQGLEQLTEKSVQVFSPKLGGSALSEICIGEAVDNETIGLLKTFGAEFNATTSRIVWRNGLPSRTPFPPT